MTQETPTKRSIGLVAAVLLANIRVLAEDRQYPSGTSIVYLQGFNAMHGLDADEAQELVEYLDGHQGEQPNFRLDADSTRSNLLITIT